MMMAGNLGRSISQQKLICNTFRLKGRPDNQEEDEDARMYKKIYIRRHEHTHFHSRQFYYIIVTVTRSELHVINIEPDRRKSAE